MENFHDKDQDLSEQELNEGLNDHGLNVCVLRSP